MRFVRVPPYESGVKMTNFYFSRQNGEFLWGQECSPHFLNQNEELSKKIGACKCIYTPPPLIGLNDTQVFSCTSISRRALCPLLTDSLMVSQTTSSVLYLWPNSPSTSVNIIHSFIVAFVCLFMFCVSGPQLH